MEKSEGSAQPVRIAQDHNSNSESLASDIAKRKTGDPKAYQRVDSNYSEENDNSQAKDPQEPREVHKENKESCGDKMKKPLPLIITGVVIALVGTLITFLAKSNKGEDHSDLNDYNYDTRHNITVSETHRAD